jgi:hypothetical protein
LLVAVVFLLSVGSLLGLAGEGIGKLILMAFPSKEKPKDAEQKDTESTTRAD